MSPQGRPESQPDTALVKHSCVIEITSKPRNAVIRKRGARKLTDIVRPITSNLVALIEDVRLEIPRLWARGIQMAHIAKMYGLTIGQAEAVVWSAYHSRPQPGGNTATTVRDSRRLHIVSERLAA